MTAPVNHLGLAPGNKRFDRLRNAFYEMIGRSKMSRRSGDLRRAYIQCLAADRLYMCMLTTIPELLFPNETRQS